MSLCTIPFLGLAERPSRLFGCPDLPVAHIPARLADRTDAEIDATSARVVSARDEACEDCLVPSSVFRGMVHSRLRAAGYAIDQARILCCAARA